MVDAVRSEYRIINRFRPNEKFDSKKLDPEGDGASEAEQLYYVDKYPEQFASPAANAVTQQIVVDVLVDGVSDAELDGLAPFDPSGDAAVAHLGLLNGKFTPRELAARIRQDLGLAANTPITAEDVFKWVAMVYDGKTLADGKSGTKRGDLPNATRLMIAHAIETKKDAGVVKAQDLLKDVDFADLNFTFISPFQAGTERISGSWTGPENYEFSISNGKFITQLGMWANGVFFGAKIDPMSGHELTIVLDPKIKDKDVREFGLVELLIRNTTIFRCNDGATLERDAHGSWFLYDKNHENPILVRQEDVPGLLGTAYQIEEIDLNGLYDDLELFGLDFNRDSFISSFGQDATIIRDPKTGKIIEARVSFKDFTKALQHDYVKFMYDPAGLDIRAHASNVYGRNVYFGADPASYKLRLPEGWVDDKGHLTALGSDTIRGRYPGVMEEARRRAEKERFLAAAMGEEAGFDFEARVAYHASDIIQTQQVSAVATGNDIPYDDILAMMHSSDPTIRDRADSLYKQRLSSPENSNTAAWRALHKAWIKAGRPGPEGETRVKDPNKVKIESSAVWVKEKVAKVRQKIEEIV